jgi:uncharacterized protein (TIGR03663 family)
VDAGNDRAGRVLAIALALLGIAALLLRVWDLGDRPFQYDEGQVAYFSWVLEQTGDYHYQPVLHGPMTYYLNALSFLVLGASDMTARLPEALAGVATVLLPLGLRRQLGTTAAVSAAALLCVSPAFVYYARFDREDAILAALVMALIVVGGRWATEPRAWHPPAAAALLAAAFATKESTYITVAIAGAGLLGAQVAGLPAARRLAAPGRGPWLLAAVVFAAAYAALFTRFGAHPEGVWDGLYDGPKYWAEQHRVNRGGEAWPLYVVMLVGQEWLLLVLGVAGAALAIVRRSVLGIALVWLFVATLATYSYAGERFAWLVLQPLLPLALLAGLGVQALLTRRRAAIAAIAAGVLVTGWLAARTALERGTDPRELLVVVHTSEAAKRAALDVRGRAARDPGLRIAVDTAEHSTFPFAWYLRGLHAGYYDLSLAPPPRDADVVLRVGGGGLSGYRARPFVQRRFWARSYSNLTPGELWRWAVHRRPWSAPGGLEATLFTK